jgi:hypothetical protein
VAKTLGPLAAELVFVGARVAELLVTDPAGTRVRPTLDSDTVVDVTGKVGYYQFGEKLKRRGFVEDDTPGAPVCRWCSGDDVLDVMPADGSVLGFRNAWYGVALDTAVQYALEPGVTIRIAAAPAFLATKWDAFHDRGADDWYGSPDVQDIVTVVAGRPEILHEIAESRQDLRNYLSAETSSFLASGLAEDVIAGALPDARMVEGLVRRVFERFTAMLG